MKRKILFLLLVSTVQLQGCSSFLNNSGLKSYYNDSNIQYHIIQRLKQDPALYNYNHVVPTVYQGTVLLAGQVMRPSERIQVQNMVQGIPGVQQIYNELTISGPNSTLTRSSDAWITSKVNAQMVLDDYLKSHAIKVVTENGIVYLMGTVSSDQAQEAEKVARRVPGVQQVVALFVIQ